MIGWLALFWALSSGSGPASADLVAGVQALRDTLRTWEQQPPADEPAAGEGESLASWFPGAAFEAMNEGVRIGLPPLYREQFAATLWADSSGGAWAFGVTMEVGEDLVVLDGMAVEGLPAAAAWAGLHQYVRQGLTALRTLGVPGAAPPAWETLEGEVEVKLVGREIDEFRFQAAVWQQGLRRLAWGMAVYAFLLEVKLGEGEAMLEWTVFLTAPGLSGHHLLHLRERLALEPVPAVRALTVRLVPGVRMDNLEDLFAPAGPERPREWRTPLFLPGR